MINVANEQEKVSISPTLESLIHQTVAAALEIEHVTDEVELSVVLVDDPYIQELNAQYRGKDCPTDVLSFAMEEGEDDQTYPGQDLGFRLLGDIVVSLETAERQAKEFGHSFEREVAFLVVHGMLHLLGYDHGDEENDPGLELMQQKQESALTRLGLARG
jgi:probable rRNA maturation factor